MRVLAAGLILCGLVVSAARAQPMRRVEPVEGPAFAARFRGVRDDGRLAFDANGEERLLASSELFAWGRYLDSDRGPQVLLADGGLLVGDVLEMTSDHLRIGDATGLGQFVWGEARLPIPTVRGLLFRPPTESLERDLLVRQIVSVTGTQDQVWLSNGDRLAGTFLGAPRPADPDRPPAFRLRVQGKELVVETAQVLALAFGAGGRREPGGKSEPSLSPAGSQTWGLRDGSLLGVQRVAWSTTRVEITLAGNLRLSTDPAFLLDELCFLRPRSPRWVALSELPVLSYKHVPFLELAWPLGVDRNVLGGRLRAAVPRAEGEPAAVPVFLQGLGMHSASRVVYDLSGSRFRRFQASLAIDASVRPRGSVIGRVFLAGDDGSWKAVFDSPVVRGTDAPLPIAVDIAGARAIALAIETADRGDEGDHANWLDARLVREEK